MKGSLSIDIIPAGEDMDELLETLLNGDVTAFVSDPRAFEEYDCWTNGTFAALKAGNQQIVFVSGVDEESGLPWLFWEIGWGNPDLAWQPCPPMSITQIIPMINLNQIAVRLHDQQGYAAPFVVNVGVATNPGAGELEVRLE